MVYALFVRATFNLLEVCAATPATAPGLGRKRPPWTSTLATNSAQTLTFMKGNVHGALLDNLDSAIVSEVDSNHEIIAKTDHHAVMCKTTLLVRGKVFIEREIV